MASCVVGAFVRPPTPVSAVGMFDWAKAGIAAKIAMVQAVCSKPVFAIVVSFLANRVF
jgi:hypothetical protein